MINRIIVSNVFYSELHREYMNQYRGSGELFTVFLKREYGIVMTRFGNSTTELFIDEPTTKMTMLLLKNDDRILTNTGRSR